MLAYCQQSIGVQVQLCLAHAHSFSRLEAPFRHCLLCPWLSTRQRRAAHDLATIRHMSEEGAVLTERPRDCHVKEGHLIPDSLGTDSSLLGGFADPRQPQIKSNSFCGLRPRRGNSAAIATPSRKSSPRGRCKAIREL